MRIIMTRNSFLHSTTPRPILTRDKRPETWNGFVHEGVVAEAGKLLCLTGSLPAAWKYASSDGASVTKLKYTKLKLTIHALTPDLWPALQDLFGKWGLQRVLVHVLANRQCLSQAVSRGEQGGVSEGGEGRAASGPDRFRWRFACWLVSAYASRCPALLDRSWRLRRVDDAPVWSISCFYTRKGYRKRGVTSALIAAALSAAKKAGAPALEAYPLDRN